MATNLEEVSTILKSWDFAFTTSESDNTILIERGQKGSWNPFLEDLGPILISIEDDGQYIRVICPCDPRYEIGPDPELVYMFQLVCHLITKKDSTVRFEFQRTDDGTIIKPYFEILLQDVPLTDVILGSYIKSLPIPFKSIYEKLMKGEYGQGLDPEPDVDQSLVVHLSQLPKKLLEEALQRRRS